MNNDGYRLQNYTIFGLPVFETNELLKVRPQDSEASARLWVNGVEIVIEAMSTFLKSYLTILGTAAVESAAILVKRFGDAVSHCEWSRATLSPHARRLIDNCREAKAHKYFYTPTFLSYLQREILRQRRIDRRTRSSQKRFNEIWNEVTNLQ